MEATDEDPYSTDTLGRCFFCLIKVEPKRESNSLSTSGSNLFQFLSRFLEVNLGRQGKVVQREEEMDLNVFKLCEECTMISEKLSELCEELGNCLKIIRNKLVKAEETGLVAGVFRKSKEGQEEEELENKPRRRGRPSKVPARPKGKLEVVEELRKEVIEKCSAKISTLLPETSEEGTALLEGENEDIPTTTDTDTATKKARLNEAVDFNCERKTIEDFKEDVDDDMIDDHPGGDDSDWDAIVESEAEATSDSESRSEASKKSSDDSTASGESDNGEDDDREEDEGQADSVPVRAGEHEELATNKSYIIIEPPNLPGGGINRKPQIIINPETGKHQCALCPKEFKKAKEFRIHYNSIHLKRTYRCIACGKDYRYRRSCKRHHQDVHLGLLKKVTTPQECRICKETFPDKAELKEHQSNSDKCGKAMLEMRAEAERAPKEKLTKMLVCDTCGKEFSVRSRLKRHINSVHLKIRNTICELCGQGFVSSDHLKRHVKAIHLGLKEHVCDECGKAFNRPSYLATHVKSVHLQLRDHVCPHCGKGFSVPESLKKHIKQVHLRDREWSCELCGEGVKFNGKVELKKHQRKVHLQIKKRKKVYISEKDKFLCTTCGKGFTRKNDLERHHKAVHLQLREHGCDKCGVAFKRKRSLVKHLKECHLKRDREGDADAEEVVPGVSSSSSSSAILKVKGQADTGTVSSLQIDAKVVENDSDSDSNS